MKEEFKDDPVHEDERIEVPIKQNDGGDDDPSYGSIACDSEEQAASGGIMHNLVTGSKWEDVKTFLAASDTSSDEKKRQLMSRGKYGEHCLQLETVYQDAPVDIIKTMLDIGGRDLMLAEDRHGWIALHRACRYGASAEVVKLLIEAGGSDTVFQQNNSGYPALHLVCMYGASAEVIKLLLDVGGRDILFTMSKKGNIALHQACINNGSLEGIKTLVDTGGKEILSAENHTGHLPIHFLFEGKKDINLETILYLQEEYQKVYPHASSVPKAFSKTLHVIQALPEADQSNIFEGSFIKGILNEKIIKTSSLLVLFLDLIVQVTVVVTFSSRIEVGLELQTWKGGVLTGCLSWFMLRELTQLPATSFYAYSNDRSNYMDILQCGLIISILATYASGVNLALLLLCIAVSWLQLVLVCGNLVYTVAVFVSALLAVSVIHVLPMSSVLKIIHRNTHGCCYTRLYQIIKYLVPFLFTLSAIIMAFAHMLHVAGPPDGINCLSAFTDDEYENGGWTCNLDSSYFHAFTMLLSGDWAFFSRPSGIVPTLVVVFASLSGVLLLNTLIAVISNVFTYVEENGQKAFWMNRLRFVNGLEIVLSFSTICWIRSSEIRLEEDKVEIVPERRFFSIWDARDYIEWSEFGAEYGNFLTWYMNDWSEEDGVVMPSLRGRLTLYFAMAEWTEIFPPSRAFRKILMGVKFNAEIQGRHRILIAWVASLAMFVLLLLSAIIMFILGFLTLGYLWPKELKQFLFFGPIESKKNEASQVGEKLTLEITTMKGELAMELGKQASELKAIKGQLDAMMHLLQQLTERQ